MGIRDRAIEAKETEELGTYQGLTYPPKYKKNLFGGPSDDYGYDGLPSKNYEREPYTPPKPGTIKLEIRVSIADLGAIADPDSRLYDYDIMLNQAELKGLKFIQEFAGKDITERYTITFTSEEEIEDIGVYATLVPKKQA